MAKIIYIVLLLSISISAQAQWRNYPWQEITPADFQRYIEWIDGSFSSRLQSIEEPYFSHVVVDQLFIRYDDGSAWVYIQQGMFGDSPYRKRMYLIYQANDTTITTKSYRLKNTDGIDINNQRLKYVLRSIQLNDLVYMEGCDSSVHMGADGHFYGGLTEGKCPGSYAGATHTTSQFRVYPDMIVSLEQGWNGTTQMWGSSSGFYYFRRLN
jgi:hypothetical protein